MITYHNIGKFLQSTKILSDHLRQLKEVLAPVIQVAEIIDSHNLELARTRDKMYHEIRSVEVLGEFLKKHVYSQTGNIKLDDISISVKAQNGSTERTAVDPNLPTGDEFNDGASETPTKTPGNLQ